MRRREFLLAGLATAATVAAGRARAAEAKKGIMLMNRIAPSRSRLFVADADGANERPLLAEADFDYHAAFSPDGRWITFTSERNGDGQSDIFRCRPDGTGIEPLVTGAAMEDAGVLSPDGATLAYVSTQGSGVANLWLLDLATRRARNLTGSAELAGDADKPDGHFRPSWSPNGEWIAFSSDRGTPWRGHDEGHGWEHTQELSIYVIRPDGSGFRQVASRPGYCLGSPRWSPDGRRIVFYEIATEATWGAHRPELVAKVGSQIVSVDIGTGERVEHTGGAGFRVAPSFLPDGSLAWHLKGSSNEGLVFSGDARPALKRALRNPSFSPDGQSVVYEKVDFKPVRPLMKPLYSWDGDWDYRHTDVFPTLSRTGELALTEKQHGDSSIVISNADGTGRRVIFDPAQHGQDPAMLAKGLAGAFQPAWSPDAEWVAFGVGVWFQERRNGKAVVMRVRRDGSDLEALTDGSVHSGFPSYSADGRRIVYRVWGETVKGLRILDLDTRQTQVLTEGYDNLPGWSPDGTRIVFTRRVDATNFDIFTIRPDGSDPKRLTTSGANDAHAVWTSDGRILWSSGMYGFRDEAALYDDTFQPYGQIMAMNADGSDKRLLTDSLWEDSMPLFLPGVRSMAAG